MTSYSRFTWGIQWVKCGIQMCRPADTILRDSFTSQCMHVINNYMSGGSGIDAKSFSLP